MIIFQYSVCLAAIPLDTDSTECTSVLQKGTRHQLEAAGGTVNPKISSSDLRSANSLIGKSTHVAAQGAVEASIQAIDDALSSDDSTVGSKLSKLKARLKGYERILKAETTLDEAVTWEQSDESLALKLAASVSNFKDTARAEIATKLPATDLVVKENMTYTSHGRPSVGSIVTIRGHGWIGKLVKADDTAMPFFVRIFGGNSSWFSQSDVRDTRGLPKWRVVWHSVFIRRTPTWDSSRISEKVIQDEEFFVDEVRYVSDGEFLHLADGRGWVIGDGKYGARFCEEIVPNAFVKAASGPKAPDSKDAFIDVQSGFQVQSESVARIETEVIA